MIKKIVEYFTNLWYYLTKKKKITEEGVIDMSTFNRSLETMASDILDANDMLKLPVNMSEIAKKHNIDVYVSKLPKGISGAIRYNDNKNKFEILLEETENHVRQRFTLAHELAHFFLERNQLEKSKEIHFDTLYRKTKNPEERDVEYLAGALLMDGRVLKRLYEVNNSIPLLAKTFDVSESALTVRLMILGLI